MDRRIEVEKKERYGQALREQMASNASASSRGLTPERELAGVSHWGAHSTGSLHPPGHPGLPPGMPPAPDTPLATRGYTPLSSSHLDHNAQTADKVAQVQDLMRQRMQHLQEEQQRQWQSVQAALQQLSVREAADLAVQQKLDALREDHAAELHRAVGDADLARRESAAAAQRAESLASEFNALRREVDRLGNQGREHHEQLSIHTTEIERLKLAHEDCARERRSLASTVAQMQCEVHEALSQCREVGRQLQQHTGQLEQLSASRQDDQRALSELRSAQDDLARRVSDVPNLITRLRDEVLRLATEAARNVLEQHKPPPARVASPPPAPLPQPTFPPEVSDEAFALLRDLEGNFFEFPALQNTVGRGATCNVCISTSQAVSNKHASMVIDRDGKSSIKDLGSRNGTFLNDRRVPQDVGFVLASGDAIRLGADGPSFIFEFGPAYYARWPQEPERVRGGQSAPTATNRRPSRGCR